MRRAVFALVVLFATTSTGHAQSQKSSDPLQGSLGSPDTASGGLRGVYGPPGSAPGQLRGVYGPPQSPAPASLPTALAAPSSSTSDAIPTVSLPGKVEAGQSLPQGVTPSPISDRPGYGRAVVNGRSAVIDMNDNRIVQFSD